MRYLIILLFLAYPHAALSCEVAGTIEGSWSDVYIVQSDNCSNTIMTFNIYGNDNKLSSHQNSNKTSYVEIDGDSNNINVTQSGTGYHNLDLQVVGDGHTIGVQQTDNGNKTATIELTNLGGAWNFNLNQTGPMGHNFDMNAANGACYTSGGCNLTVTQQ